jgi:hypothetical protein
MLRCHRGRLALFVALLASMATGWLPARAATVAVDQSESRREGARRRPPRPVLPVGAIRPGVPAGEPGTTPPGAPKPFNLDRSGLPQDEESVTSCPARPDVVLGGVNDYRVLAVVPGDGLGFSGWQLSLDGGASVANDGLLPAVTVGGVRIPSAGDPVVAAAPDCHLYYGTLDLPLDGETPSAVTVHRSTPETLASCAGAVDPGCWPVHRIVASSTDPNVSLDKEWMDVGVSGAAGVVVWVAWAEFRRVGPGPNDETSRIRAARCDSGLTACTAPTLISGRATDVQFADVTIGPDGRTYLSWTEIRTDPVDGAERFVHKLRIAPAGSTRFGRTRVVATERSPISFDAFLHADDFRVGTYPKNTVAMVDGRPRIFVTWDACRRIVAGTTCEEPKIRLRYSDDDGRTWTETSPVSTGGDNYFPTIDADPATGKLAVAYYTNRADPFHHRQQVELVTVDAATVSVLRRQTVSPLNEPDADPLLGGTFIGDYFEVSADQGRALVHFNANYRFQKFLGEGVPVPQQDNYLVAARL